MTIQRKLEIWGAAIVLLILAIVIGVAVQSRKQLSAAATSASADQKTVQTLQQAINANNAAQAKSDAASVKAQAAITTPQQAAQVIIKYLPQPAEVNGVAPPPIQIPVIPTTDLPQSVQKDFPNDPSVGIVGSEELQSIAKNDTACTATQFDLSTCKANLLDTQMQLKTQTDETSTWKAAAKGGSFKQKLLHSLKCIGESSALATIGAIAYKSKPAIGAAAGAGAGAIACSIF